MTDYTVDDAEFTDPISITETTDPGHADYINAAPKQLFGNTKYNKAQIEALKKRTIAELSFENNITAEQLLEALGIEKGANKTTVDTALSSTSSNPVANSVVTNALNNKSDTSHTHSLWNTTCNIVLTCTNYSTYEGYSVSPDTYTTDVDCLMFTLDTAIKPDSFEAAIESISGFSIKGIVVDGIKQVILSSDEAPELTDSQYFGYGSALITIYSYEDVVKYVRFSSYVHDYGEIIVDTGDTETLSFAMSALKQTLLI